MKKEKHHYMISALTVGISYNGVSKTMVIITFYEKICNPEGTFLIKSKELSYCPVCNSELFYYDSRIRYVIHDDGIKHKYSFRRLECRCETCSRRIHTEIPDFAQPYKHHAVSVIQTELDNPSDSCPAEISTTRIWIQQFDRNFKRIESVLKAEWQKVYKKPYSLVADSLLKKLKNSESNWLTIVTQICIKGHYGIPTQFAFVP